MPVHVTCKFEKRLINWWDIVFPIISQRALSVAMEITVLIQSVPKLYAAFPQVMLHILIKIGQLASEIFNFKNVDDDDRRTADHWYTISSPCEPSAQVS